ncbi:MAG: alpha/beta hydrolase, partial [Pseudomonadales bacterium]|nr:alpha/beta hydrolase [Pseudomonadales bacterium]
EMEIAMGVLVMVFWFWVRVAVMVWAIARFYLRGAALSAYDRTPPAAVGGFREPSAEHHEVVELLKGFASAGAGVSSRDRLKTMRDTMDAMGDDADLEGVQVTRVDTDGVPGEWVLAEGADPNRRLLYLHGGAFTMGSPRSHRPITTTLSRIAGASVLAVDYRLMPEHRRLDCLTDCQRAYRWILENGPQGKRALETLFVAGDSAGGNLTLAVIAWARDSGLRPAEAAVALSPATDATFTSPSLASNVATDHMLGPMFGRITRLPRVGALWFSWFAYRVRPSDPRVSPVFGDLSNLPPTLVHASEAEMLLDDARRYVNKANAAGSEATLETWHHMLHVWHAFEQKLPEAREAFEHIGRFLELCAPRKQSALASA